MIEHNEEQYFNNTVHLLSTEQLAQAKGLAHTLAQANSDHVLHFGLSLQEKNAQISHQMLLFTQRKDVSRVSEVLNELVSKLIDVNPELLIEQKPSFLQKLFGKSTVPITQVMTNFQRLFVQIDRLGIQLQYAQQSLLQDVNGLKSLVTLNAEYLKELELHIVAIELGKQQLESLNTLKNKSYSNDMIQVDEATSIAQLIDQRHYDLQLSRQLSLQTMTQLQMMIETYEQLTAKIQNSILSTIPLWKNQMSMLFTLNKQLTAAKFEQQLLLASQNIAHKKTVTAQFTQQQTNFSLETLKDLRRSLLQMIEDTIQTQQQQIASEINNK